MIEGRITCHWDNPALYAAFKEQEMNGYIYVQMIQHMTRRKVLDHVVGALRVGPMTAAELARHLEETSHIVTLAISFLRKRKYIINNRGSKGGPNGRKGTYYLIREPSWPA